MNRGEVEEALTDVTGISGAVVVLSETLHREPILKGYYVGSETLNAHEIRIALRQRLPSVMVPTELVRLEKFPLTPNGRIDRNALSALNE